METHGGLMGTHGGWTYGDSWGPHEDVWGPIGTHEDACGWLGNGFGNRFGMLWVWVGDGEEMV